jgi:O-antigen/teichoic acid export membrane protein
MEAAMASRLSMTFRNAFWSYISMIATLVLRFVSRTVFIHFLGANYLGINGLFTNILGVLSFAELGIGTAMNFSLYKPVAQQDVQKIKSYMYCYKWAYRFVAVIVSGLGLLLLPFLDTLVKDPGNVGDIRVYYLIYLFDTVISYFVAYKFSIAYAEQKGYLFTNINTLVSTATVVAQIAALYLWRNYVVYLLISSIVNLLKNIFVSRYLNRLYPYLKDRDAAPLPKEELMVLVRKIKALIVHKIGEISVHQTDNIIISAFINVGTVGLISNYNLLMTTISSFINVLFNSVTGSLGNLVATESKAKQYEIFRIYRFIGFWFYGFTAIALFVLSTPFITLWLGADMVVSDVVIGLILLNYYMMGHRICLNNIKTVGGLVEQDKYVALIQSAVNLVSSVALVRVIGLPGVYLGTILQGMISTIVKPLIVYKTMFGISPRYYFIDAIKYLAALILGLIPCLLARQVLLQEVSLFGFILTMAVTALVPNGLFLLLFFRRAEFRYVLEMGRRLLSRKI